MGVNGSVSAPRAGAGSCVREQRFQRGCDGCRAQ